MRDISQALEQTPVTIVITDPAGNIEYVNPSVHQVNRLYEGRGCWQEPPHFEIRQDGATNYKQHVGHHQLRDANGGANL